MWRGRLPWDRCRRRVAARRPAAEGRTPKVLVIGVDGVRPGVLAEVSTPTLDALAEQGAYTGDARTGLPSVSGPGWSSMLLGVWPEKYGVIDNTFEGKRYGQYPDFLTRLEQVRPELSTFAVADWLPLVAHEEGGPVVSDALFVYLGNPDETSHNQGSIGKEYREALALADRHVGELVAAIRARPTYPTEDWLALSSTDHGRRADGGMGGHPRGADHLLPGQRSHRSARDPGGLHRRRGRRRDGPGPSGHHGGSDLGARRQGGGPRRPIRSVRKRPTATQGPSGRLSSPR